MQDTIFKLLTLKVKRITPAFNQSQLVPWGLGIHHHKEDTEVQRHGRWRDKTVVGKRGVELAARVNLSGKIDILQPMRNELSIYGTVRNGLWTKTKVW